jgi:uncharacterized SAM-binding protein YcdF (DUF218 family)
MPTARQERPNRRWPLVVVVLLGADIALTSAFWWYAHASTARPPALPSAAPLVVFYSSIPASRDARLAAAVEAYARHGERRVLVVGGARPSQQRFGAEDMARALIARGIPAQAIATERNSYDTVGNLQAALRLADGAETLVLVSERPHLLRIGWLLARLGTGQRAVPYPVDTPGGVVARWWQAHYECVAWLSLLMPDGVRTGILRAVRP